VILQYACLDDGIDRTGLLAETAEDALREIDIVAAGTASAVLTLLGFDGNRKRRAYRFAELAGDAAFFPIRITSQGMQALETR